MQSLKKRNQRSKKPKKNSNIQNVKEVNLYSKEYLEEQKKFFQSLDDYKLEEDVQTIESSSKSEESTKKKVPIGYEDETSSDEVWIIDNKPLL